MLAVGLACAAGPARAAVEFKRPPAAEAESGVEAGLLGAWLGASETEALLLLAAAVLVLLRLTVWRHHRYRRRGLIWLLTRGRSSRRWWAD